MRLVDFVVWVLELSLESGSGVGGVFIVRLIS